MVATRYINSFAINEKDQLEISAFITKTASTDVFSVKLDEAMQVIENLTMQQNEGLDYFSMN